MVFMNFQISIMKFFINQIILRKDTRSKNKIEQRAKFFEDKNITLNNNIKGNKILPQI